MATPAIPGHWNQSQQSLRYAQLSSPTVLRPICHEKGAEGSFWPVICTQVLPILLQGLQAISGLRPEKPSTKVQLVQLYVMLDNGIYKLAKTMTNLLETHPW